MPPGNISTSGSGTTEVKLRVVRGCGLFHPQSTVPGESDHAAQIIDDAKGQFKITFNLKDQPMQAGTYALQITVRDKDGSALKTLTGSLNIQPEAL